MTNEWIGPLIGVLIAVGGGGFAFAVRVTTMSKDHAEDIESLKKELHDLQVAYNKDILDIRVKLEGISTLLGILAIGKVKDKQEDGKI